MMVIMIVKVVVLVVIKVKHGKPKAHLVCLLPARFDGVDHDNEDGGGCHSQSQQTQNLT